MELAHHQGIAMADRQSSMLANNPESVKLQSDPSYAS